jgi:acyl-CoA synthetase (AMP-forming)/AMP-acid ligase II
VEDTLAGALGVYGAAVLGVPDEMMGERVRAVIVPVPGPALGMAVVLDCLAAHVAGFKIPRYAAASATAPAARSRRQAAQAVAPHGH